jgi:hypothetical protein
MKKNIISFILVSFFSLVFLVNFTFAFLPQQSIVNIQNDYLNCKVKINGYVFYQKEENSKSLNSIQIIKNNFGCENYEYNLNFNKNSEENFNGDYNYFNCKSLNGKIVCSKKNLIYDKKKFFEKKYTQYNFRSMYSII